uniref:UDP-4-amino-4-deoxy-L-arabinose--oxoglutarate aminotransferase n=1 Tax=Rheinheimera sp. BAL341 TaxID=1708203 RepID=A0A486XXE0_9GAMM
MIPHNKLVFSREDKAFLHAVVESGFYTMGKHTAALENLCQDYFNYPFAIAASSGSMALRLALIAAGVQQGDSVIVPAYSCSALPNVVLSLGAKVLAVDVLHHDCNIDPVAAIALAKQHAAKVVIAVNTFGAPANVKVLQAAGLLVIEDCSHGFGLDENDKPCVSGDFVVQSFYATKLVGAAELGVVLTKNKKCHAVLDANRSGYSTSPIAGCLNVKPDEMNAVLVISKLRHITNNLKQRQALAEHYLSSSLIRKYYKYPLSSRVWYRFVICTHQAEQIIAAMSDVAVLVKPVSPWLDNLDGYPVSQCAFRNNVSVPLYPCLSELEQVAVMSKLRTVLVDFGAADE